MQYNLSTKKHKVQDSNIYLKIGDDYFIRKKFDECENFYDLAIKINPLCSQAYINKGRLYTRLKRYDEANLMFDKADDNNQQNYQVPFNRGLINIKFKELYTINQANIKRLFNYLIMQQLQIFKIPSCTQINVIIHSNKVKSLISLGQIKDAKAICQKAFPKYQERLIKFCLKKGDFLIAQGKIEEGLQIFNIAIDFNPDYEQYIDRGNAYFEENHYDIAIQFYKMSITLNPRYSSHRYFNYWEKGDKLVIQGKIEEANQMFNIAIQFNPDSQKYMERGYKQLEQKQYDLALYFYDILIKLNKEEGCLLKGYALLYFQETLQLHKAKSKRHSRCLILRFNYVLIKKQRSQYQQILGFLYLKLKQYDVALYFSEILIKLNQKQGFFLKGDTLIAQGKIEEALQVYNLAIQLNQDYKEYLSRGDKYFQEKYYDVAIYFYDKLIEFNHSQGYLKKGDTLIAIGKLEEAIQIFNKASEFNPDNKEYIDRGYKLLEEKQYELANFFYDTLIKLNQAQGYFLKGETLISQGKFEEAFQMFNITIQLNPDYKEYVRKGYKYLKEKQYDVATYFYEILIKQNKEQGYLLKGDTLIAQGKIEEALEMFTIAIKFRSDYEGVKYSRRAHQYFQDKQYDVALLLYQLLINHYSFYREYYIVIVDNLIAKGQIEEAFQMFNIAIQFNPYYEGYIKKGYKYLEQKEYDLTRLFYEILLKFNPLQGYILKGDTLVALGKMEEAIQIFNKVNEFNPNDKEYIDRGYTYLKEKQYDLAKYFYEILIQQNKVQGYFLKGETLIAQGKMEQAIQVLNNSIQFHPIDKEYKDRGNKYFEDQQYDVAIQFYKLLIILSPGQMNFYLNKGDTLVACGKIDEALQMFIIAIQFKPHYEDYIRRGDKHFLKKEYDIAKHFYEMSIKLNTQQGYLKLGDTLIAQEKIEEAIQIFNMAFEFNPDYEEYLQRGYKYLEEKQYDLALYFFELIIKLNQQQGFFLKGDSLLAQGKIEEALQIFSYQIQLNSDVQEYLKRGDFYFKEKQYYSSMQFYQLLIKLVYLKKGQDIANDKIQEQFLMLKNSILSTPNLQKFTQNQQREIKFQIDLFVSDLLIYLQPENTQYQLNKGYLLYALGKISEAINTFKDQLQKLSENKMNLPQQNITKEIIFQSLHYMLCLARETQDDANMIYLIQNLESPWDHHQVLLLQEQSKYTIPRLQKNDNWYVGSKLVIYK